MKNHPNFNPDDEELWQHYVYISPLNLCFDCSAGGMWTKSQQKDWVCLKIPVFRSLKQSELRADGAKDECADQGGKCSSNRTHDLLCQNKLAAAGYPNLPNL